MEIIQSIQIILELVITIAGAFFAFWIYIRDRRREYIKTLVKQVIAYYCEEQILLEELAKAKNVPKANKDRDIIREQSANHIKNQYKVKPEMTPGEAKKFLDIKFDFL